MARKMLKGNHPGVISANIKMLKANGYSHARATRCALCHANKKNDKHVKRIAEKVTKKSDTMQVKG